MIQVNDFRPGVSFKNDGQILTVLDVVQNKTARGQMIVKAKVKNLRTGSITEISFTGGDKVEPVYIDKFKMQYLYDDSDNYIFMNTENFEQTSVAKSKMAWESKFIIENLIVEIAFYNQEILGIILPAKVVLKVTETEPAIRGDTVNKSMKNATLQTGHVTKVPLFINIDDDLIINTTDGSYDSRA